MKVNCARLGGHECRVKDPFPRETSAPETSFSNSATSDILLTIRFNPVELEVQFCRVRIERL